jgi:hypothetical protein
MARVIDQFVFNINGAARDTDNNKLHNEKTPQPTKGQRYDRLTEENISNIVEGKNSLG